MKVHQNIEIDGVDYGDRKSRKYSNFCNEGKWNNFIKPLLPVDCTDMTLVEMGSNAGLFLRLSKEMGFRYVMGIERDKEAYDMSLEYTDAWGIKCDIVNTNVTENFDFRDIPLADVVLLANFHYHMIVQDFLVMLDAVEHKTRYCLIVSIDSAPKQHYNTDARIEKTREYFKNWKEVGVVNPISMEGDSHPRNGMYGILFESKLTRVPLDNILRPDGKEVILGDSFKRFIELAKSGVGFDVRKTLYYKKIFNQKGKKLPEEEIFNLVNGKKEMIRDFVRGRIMKPIIVDKDFKLLDGGTRVMVAKELGYKSIIVRVL